MEAGRSATDGAKSAVRHGCLFARPAGVFNLKIAQQPAGLNIRKKPFAYFWAFQKWVSLKAMQHMKTA
jgi:hypothetical protein